MSNLVKINPGMSNDDFLNMMAKTEMGEDRPRPRTLRMNGQTGMYEFRKWNKEKKEMETEVVGPIYEGTILMVRWFAKWKYNQSETGKAVRTREFSTFDESIELLSMDYEKGEEATKVIGTFNSYADFKNEYAVKDKVTDKVTVPFDLWASVYLADLVKNEVVNLRLKGDSRSNLWDYLGGYKKQLVGAKALAGVLTYLSREEKAMPASKAKKEGDPDTYYAATFKAKRLLDPGELEKSKEGVQYLLAWMKSFKTEQEELPTIQAEEPVEPIKSFVGDDIKVEDLPF